MQIDAWIPDVTGAKKQDRIYLDDVKVSSVQ
jgi:hypothetical protein